MMINMKDKEEVKDIIVSDIFMEVYKNFNVYDQVETMKQLEPRELYLLLTLCLDKHDDDNVIVKHNLLPFRSEVLDIYDIQDDKDPGNKILSDLIKENVENAFDHKNLNLDVPDFANLNPTAENIAVVIWNKLRPQIDTNKELEITLYETPRNFVTYKGN